jgi:hypothetical protein
MHGGGFFIVWVTLLVIGVIGSISSSARKQAQSRGGPAPSQPPQRPVSQRPAVPEEAPEWLQRAIAQMQQPVPPPPPARRPTPAPPPAKPRPPAPAQAPKPQPVQRLYPRPEPSVGQRLFSSRRAIVRAVIAAEVLGKPRAFGDEYIRNP